MFVSVAHWPGEDGWRPAPGQIVKVVVADSVPVREDPAVRDFLRFAIENELAARHFGTTTGDDYEILVTVTAEFSSGTTEHQSSGVAVVPTLGTTTSVDSSGNVHTYYTSGMNFVPTQQTTASSYQSFSLDLIIAPKGSENEWKRRWHGHAMTVDSKYNIRREAPLLIRHFFECFPDSSCLEKHYSSNGVWYDRSW